MCLAIPGKVIEVSDVNGVLTGLIDFEGVRKKACLDYVPDVKAGEYVVVHVGFALSKIDETEARRVFEFLKLNSELTDGESPDEVRG